jgi:hypothetical protein
MLYYNSNGKLINYNLNEPKFYGKSSKIFQLEDNCCLKQYFPYSTRNVRIDLETFNILKKLNHPNVNKVLEIYYEENKIKKIEYLKSHIQDLEVDAYKYLYIEDSFIDIIKEPTEYLLYNLEELEKLTKIFTELKIWMRDFKRENTVFFKDKIILIDLDCCKLVKSNSVFDLYSNNIDCLQNLFIDLFEKCKSYSYRYENEIFDLFSLDGDRTITSSVSKKLCKYKTPLDYIKNHQR